MTTINKSATNLRIPDFFFFAFRTIIKQLLLLC
jgi:hypothetical protein